jgi:hypothetical protein
MKANFDKGTKICSKCKRELSIEMFQKNRTASDGLTCRCKECLSSKSMTEEERERRKQIYKKYHASEKGAESRKRINEKRRNDPEYKEKNRQKSHEYYHKNLAHPKELKQIEIDENGNKFFVCIKCARRLPLDMFPKDTSNRLGFHYSCKDCYNEYRREKSHTEEYRAKNKEKSARFRATKEGREYMRAYGQKRLDENEQARMNLRLHNSLRKMIHRPTYNGCMVELVGCSRKKFIDFMESQFEEGMSWDNYGKIWHVDHIVPCSYFDLTDKDDQRVCFNWRNSQPLFSKENFSKGNTLTEGSQELVDFICKELNIKKKIELKLRTREN